jgi:ribose transport system permease protein
MTFLSSLFWRRDFRALLFLLVLIAFFGCMHSSVFSFQYGAILLRTLSLVGFVAVGQALLLITGELDLSVGSIAGLSAVVSGVLMKYNFPTSVALIGGLACGTVAGYFNGFMTAVIGIPAFIATLAMLYMGRGFVYVLTQGYPIYPLPSSLVDWGTSGLFNLSLSCWILLLLVFLCDVMLHYTTFGVKIIATGSNPLAASSSRISIVRVKVLSFVFSGFLAALAGIFTMIKIQTGDPQIGTGWELEAIAAAVIGGVSLKGGIGTVWGTLIGLILMQVIRSGLIVIGISSHWQSVVTGLLLLTAIVWDLTNRGESKIWSNLRNL